MHYNFVKYKGKYLRGDNKISIQKSGLVRLSSGFCRITNAMNYKYSVLFFDSSKRAIAFKFTNEREEGALKVTKDRNAATISAKSFMSANHLSSRSYFRRYDWVKQNISEIGEVFIIELDKK